MPHTADTRLQAWAPTREECLAEAVAALVDTFADVTGRKPQRTVVADIAAGTDEDTLAGALDEVIYVVETSGMVPVGVRAEAVAPRASQPFVVRLHLAVAALSDVEITGPAPKAVTRHHLRIGRGPAGWSCEATVDV